MSLTLISDAINAGIELVNKGNSITDSARILRTNNEVLSNIITLEGLRKRISRAMAGEVSDKAQETLLDYCSKTNTDITSVPLYWDKSNPGLSAMVKNPFYISPVDSETDNGLSYYSLRDAIVKDMETAAPSYPLIKRQPVKTPYLLIVDPADAHFGKYATVSETGMHSDLQHTETRFSQGIEGLINLVQGYTFEKIVFVGGNDVLHTDNALRTTTSGTPQDTSGMWHEHYLSAKKATIAAIDRLLTIADVHFVFCPSNHDFLSGFFLCDAIKSHYHNNQNITFDVTPIHRKYIQYGTSLIGLTHADGAKEADLPDLMKTEAKAAWAVSEYSYWYLHHIHHKVKSAKKGTLSVKLEKDYRGVTVLNTGRALLAKDYCFVEYVRSISSPDRWHFTKGYAHAPIAMEAFIHHPEYGQVNRMTHLF